MTTDRDPRVAALLDTIEPVPPRPGFWAELEQRLRDEPSPALELARVPGAEASRHAAALRRRRVVAGIAAAAAVVVVALASAVLRDDRDDTETVPVQPGPSVTEPSQSKATDAPDAPQGLAVGYLDEWIRSLVEGDTTHGWDLLGPQSQASLGSQAAYAAALEDLRGTWASYANLDALDATVAQLGDTDAWLVALRHHSGDPQPLVAIVRLDAQGDTTGRVEPFVPGPALDLIQMAGLPQAEGGLGPGDLVPLHLGAGAEVAVVLDGYVLPDTSLERDADGTVTGFRLAQNVEAGVHVVAVAEQLPTGSLAADTRSFNVAISE